MAPYQFKNTEHAANLFALSELGTQRPVTAFVQPLRASRLIARVLGAHQMWLEGSGESSRKKTVTSVLVRSETRNFPGSPTRTR